MKLIDGVWLHYIVNMKKYRPYAHQCVFIDIEAKVQQSYLQIANKHIQFYPTCFFNLLSVEPRIDFEKRGMHYKSTNADLKL